MVIETVRPFHFRDLGNWTVEQGALWAVVELSLPHSPSFQENNGAQALSDNNSSA